MLILCFLSQKNITNIKNPIKNQKKNDTNFLDFFKLYEKNPLIFHIFSLTNGLIGIFMVFFIQNIFLLKFSNFFDKKIYLQIYTSTFFGFFSQITHILSSVLFFVLSEERNFLPKKIFNFSIFQVLFYVEIICTFLYGVLICGVIIFVNKNLLKNFSKEKISTNFMVCKIVCLIYLIFITLNNVLFLLVEIDKNKNEIFITNQSNLFSISSYVIYLLNSLFYFLLFDLFEDSKISHVEYTSQNVYDKSDKNML